MKFDEEINIEDMKNSIVKYPFETAMMTIIVVVFFIGFYFMEYIPFIKNLQKKMDEIKQKMIVSLIVRNGEIQNTNSWSFSNIALYWLDFFDMV
jgi:hypothetical protein